MELARKSRDLVCRPWPVRDLKCREFPLCILLLSQQIFNSYFKKKTTCFKEESS